MTSNPGYAPPSYDDSNNDPKYGSVPPSGMTESETAYLPAAEGGVTLDGVGFEDNNVRRLFIRKVYSILTLQLIFTGAVIAAFQTSDTLRDYVGPGTEREGLWLVHVSYVFFIFTYFCLVCPCCNFQRRYPLNIVFLCLLTLSLSIMTGIIAVYFDTEVVCMAAGTTALVVAVVTGLTFWTKFDITQFWYIMLIMPIGMFLVWPFLIFMPGVGALHTAYCGMGVVCFTLYLAFDTKMIMGGGRFQLDPDDYIVAVVQLYVDIVQIFLYLLQIFGRSD